MIPFKITLAAVAVASALPLAHVSAQDMSVGSIEDLAWITGHGSVDALGGQARVFEIRMSRAFR